MVCFVCGRDVNPDFNYFCFACYHNLKHKLGVSRSDFRKYLRYGLGVHLRIPEDWNFKQMYEHVLEKHPTLFSLANLIENALFLKLMFSKDLDLRPSYCYPSNDNLTSTNHRVVCSDYRGANSKPHKQTCTKQSEIRLLL